MKSHFKWWFEQLVKPGIPNLFDFHVDVNLCLWALGCSALEGEVETVGENLVSLWKSDLNW